MHIQCLSCAYFWHTWHCLSIFDHLWEHLKGLYRGVLLCCFCYCWCGVSFIPTDVFPIILLLMWFDCVRQFLFARKPSMRNPESARQMGSTEVAKSCVHYVDLLGLTRTHRRCTNLKPSRLSVITPVSDASYFGGSPLSSPCWISQRGLSCTQELTTDNHRTRPTKVWE